MGLSSGTRLGPYEIVAPLGAGGMGEVYRALDTKLNRPVAIKVLSADLGDAGARRRFQREAQTASSISCCSPAPPTRRLGNHGSECRYSCTRPR